MRCPLAVILLSLAGFAQTPNQPAETSPQETQQPAAQKPPLETSPDGIYYQADQKYIAIDPLMMSGGGAKHVGKMFVPGLTPQMVWTYRGAEAPVRFKDPRPVFYFKQSPQMAQFPGRTYRDLVIVQFDKKKDHRELQATNGGNMFTFKAGLSKEKMPDFDIEKITDGTYKITLKQDLKPGEYLIGFGIATSGYDFGVDQAPAK
jgi:hypothetical protein